VRAMEKQKRDVIHFHCLLGSPELYKLKRLDWMYQWEDNCGWEVSGYPADPNRFDRLFTGEQAKTFNIKNGFARIYKYDSRLDGKNYVSKYVTKGADNIDMYVAPPQWNLVNNKEQRRLAFYN